MIPIRLLLLENAKPSWTSNPIMKSSVSKEIFVPLTSNVNELSFSSPCIISSGFVSEKISIVC